MQSCPPGSSVLQRAVAPVQDSAVTNSAHDLPEMHSFPSVCIALLLAGVTHHGQICDRHMTAFGGVFIQDTKDLARWYSGSFNASCDELQQLSGEQLAKWLNFRSTSLLVVLCLQIAINRSIHHRRQLSTHLRSMGERVRQSTATALMTSKLASLHRRRAKLHKQHTDFAVVGGERRRWLHVLQAVKARETMSYSKCT